MGRDRDSSSAKAGTARKGHPLPRSEEARQGEIPERLVREKGRGDDAPALVQPGDEAAAPDGGTYPYADLGRGPEAPRRTSGNAR